MTKVYIANGHGHKDDGGFDPGAVSRDGLWHEQKAGDFIVSRAASLLSSWGVDVKHEAFQDDPNYPGTTRAANAWGADYVVEVHHDWNRAPEGAFGHWVSAAGKALADRIQQAVGAAGFPLRPSWHKRRTDLYILKNTVAPCVLYECGRIGQGDLDTESELKAMGTALAAGIADHLGVKPLTTPAAVDSFDPDAAKAALGEIKTLVGVLIGQTWDAADYGRIVEGVRAAVDR